MGRLLDEHAVKCAELALSTCFEKYGSRKVPAQVAIQYGKTQGLYRAEIKEARKRLGIKSVDDGSTHWWIWPNDSKPNEVNAELSKEFWEEIENARKRD